jgi:hypothetical protein
MKGHVGKYLLNGIKTSDSDLKVSSNQDRQSRLVDQVDYNFSLLP